MKKKMILCNLKNVLPVFIGCVLLLLTVTNGAVISLDSPKISAPEVYATVPNAQFEKIKANIQNLIREGNVPSVSVAVAQGGKIIWEEAFGWANREKMIPASPHTMYSLASISKPITATGLMILVERGLIKLDESVNTYIAPTQLTAYEGNASDATIKHLLNHTAGLPLHYSFFYEDEPYHKPIMAESIRRYGILVHPPGEKSQYSNFGYGLLNYIIKKVSGRKYSDFMKNEVFLPLGMMHSSVNIGPGLEGFAAKRYDSDNKPIPFYDFDHPGASAVYCSAHDLVRFGMFHLKDHLPDQKAILDDKTIDKMHVERDKEAANWNEKTKSGYALGWSIGGKDDGYLTLSHGGGMPGVTTILGIFPTEDIAVVVLSNCSNQKTNLFAVEIIGEVLPKFKENREKNRKKERPKPSEYKPTPELQGVWSGLIKTYEGEEKVTMTVQEDGDIHFKQEGLPATLLNDIRFENNLLIGNCFGSISTEDAKRHDHNLSIKVYLKGNRLVGYISARSTTERLYGAISSYISLEKQE